jgi:hypothetical protein
VRSRGIERVSETTIRAEVVSVTQTAPLPEAIPVAAPSEAPPAASPPPLEERVTVLEQRVTQLQDTRALEERVYQRVVSRVPQSAGGSATSWLGKLNPFRGREASLPVASGWLLMDMLSEARFLVSMIADSRYQMTWASRIGVVVCLVLIITSGFWNPLSWFLPDILDKLMIKLVTLIVAFFLFKILARETQRYRAFLQSLS